VTDPAPAAPNTEQPGLAERLLGATEPVRRALYPVVVAVVALLVAYGVIDAERAPLWIGLAVAILGPAAVETARAVAWSPASVTAYGASWSAALDDEYARGVADALERTPERVAAEVIDDEPGEHAAPEPEPGTVQLERAEPVTGMMRAPSRATRCREVDDGKRCLLTRDHEGPHMMTTG